MRSMRTNGASKNRDNCFFVLFVLFPNFSSFSSFFPTPKLFLVFWRGFSLPYLWYRYLWYIWWFFWVISFENFWGDFLGNFLTYNLLAIAHNAQWHHFSPIGIFPEFFDCDFRSGLFLRLRSYFLTWRVPLTAYVITYINRQYLGE